MTREEFDIAAETWYQRTHRLREYSEDELNSEEKRNKAHKLFIEMFGGMLLVVRTTTRLSMPKPKGQAGAPYRKHQHN